MPNKYPLEVRQRATRMALDRLPDYPSPWAACRDLGEMLTPTENRAINARRVQKWPYFRSASTQEVERGSGDAAEVGPAGSSRCRDEVGALGYLTPSEKFAALSALTP